MRKISIAVCDTNAAYSSKLGEWITLEHGRQSLGYSFSTPEGFLEFQKTKKVDVVLLGTGFWEDARITGQVLEAMSKGSEISQDSKDTLWIYLYDSVERERFPESTVMIPRIHKYQAASGIVREIFAFCQKYRKEEQEIFVSECEVIGIYSPGHSIWQTPFALTLAQVLNQKERVIYVNLNECAGFSVWLKEDYQRDLLDVMYLCLTGEGCISDCIKSAVYSIEGFDYIPPAWDGICLGQISKEDYVRFFRLLIEKSGYDIVILDFGMMIPGFLELFGMCGKVYVLKDRMGLQEFFLAHFKEMVARQGNQELEEKLLYLSLPSMITENGSGQLKMQQWIWGELGDYIRQLVGVQIGTDQETRVKPA